MKKLLLILLMVFVLPGVAGANTILKESDVDGFHRYINHRFAYSIDFPEQFNKIVINPTNGDGIKISTQDGSAWLQVSGGHNMSTENYFKSQYYDKLENLREKVTYSVLADNYFIVSWLDGLTIYYFKQFFNSEYQNHFLISYPHAQKTFYDEAIVKIEKSFIPSWKTGYKVLG